MSQNRGLGGVWGNDDAYVHWESHRNGVLCGNWGGIAVGVAQGGDEWFHVEHEKGVGNRVWSASTIQQHRAAAILTQKVVGKPP